MGTGKSTVGLLLARRLGMQFVDTDSVVEAEVGLSVADIFSKHGEPAFRAYERAACHRLAGQSGQVIATGGGAIVDQPSRSALEGTGVLVLLTCDRDVLLQRLEDSARRGERPLLSGDLEARLDRLLVERESVYSTIPLKVDTTHLTPEQAANRVLALYSQAPRSLAAMGIIAP